MTSVTVEIKELARQGNPYRRIEYIPLLDRYTLRDAVRILTDTLDEAIAERDRLEQKA